MKVLAERQVFYHLLHPGQGNELLYSSPLWDLWGIVPGAGLVTVGGTWTVWVTFTDQEREELGHQSSGKPAVRCEP